MSSRGYFGDISALLYLSPFAISGAYAIILWVRTGLSYFLPPSVYLTVTRDPIVFAIGTIAVILGVALDESSVEPSKRGDKVEGLGKTLQAMAFGSLVLAIASALYANGFRNISGAANDFTVGRYGLVFPVFLFLMSYLITAKVDLSSVRKPRVLGIVAMLLAPVSIYELGRRSPVVGLTIALVLIIAGAALFLGYSRKQIPKNAA